MVAPLGHRAARSTTPYLRVVSAANSPAVSAASSIFTAVTGRTSAQRERNSLALPVPTRVSVASRGSQAACAAASNHCSANSRAASSFASGYLASLARSGYWARSSSAVK